MKRDQDEIKAQLLQMKQYTRTWTNLSKITGVPYSRIIDWHRGKAPAKGYVVDLMMIALIQKGYKDNPLTL